MPFRNFLTGNRKPGYRELALMIQAAIEDGRLPGGTSLPPTRLMAENLGISRDTVVRCYKHLQSLAYVEPSATRGTLVRTFTQGFTTGSKGNSAGGVADHAGDNFVQKNINPTRLSAYAARLTVEDAHAISPDFPALNYGSVPPHALPIRRWRELVQTHSHPAAVRHLRYDMEVLGRGELRKALSNYVNRVKEIACTPDEITVFNISFTSFSLICRLLLNPGDLIAIEEPGFGGIKNVASYHGFEVYPVPLDEDGLVVETLDKSARPIKLIYVSPDHQEPTGKTMPIDRRKQLIAWAQKNGAWIIEDDYDGFFHYGQHLPPSLKSLDNGEHVIYFGSFWQLLYPLTTVCFVVLPAKLMPIVGKSKIETEGMTEAMLQLALADMIESGYLQKHARKLERAFAVKVRTLMFLLKQAFGKDIQVATHSAGLTLMLQFNGWPDGAISEASKTAHLPMMSTAYYYHGKGTPGEFLLYFPGLGDEREIKLAVEVFAAALMASKV